MKCFFCFYTRLLLLMWFQQKHSLTNEKNSGKKICSKSDNTGLCLKFFPKVKDLLRDLWLLFHAEFKNTIVFGQVWFLRCAWRLDKLYTIITLIQSHLLIDPNKILLPLLHIKLGVMKKFMKAMEREGSRLAFLQKKFPHKHGEIHVWYIWQLSNKRIHEGPNVWESAEWSWTIYLVVTKVSSYKLPEKPPECRIQERH